MVPRDVIELARENDSRLVEVRFMDLVGSWRHFVMPAKELTEEFLSAGRFLEGSALRGCHSADFPGVLVVPDPATARPDPFSRVRTLCLIGSLHDPVTGAPLPRDPRTIAKMARDFCSRGKIPGCLRVSAEIDYYVFDEVRYDQTRNSGYFFVDSDEGRITAARDEGAQKSLQKDSCYLPAHGESPADLSHEIIEEFFSLNPGVRIDHWEGQGPGQGTVALSGADLVTQADNLMWLKYVVKNVARKYGRTATFMPRPLSEDSPSGLNLLWSFERDGEDLFSGRGYGRHSEEALFFTGGLLGHAAALSAFVNPTTNSFRRLAPGCDSPVNLAYSLAGKAVAAGLGGLSRDGARTVRFRLPDPAMNPYLGLAAVAMAGFDGMESGMNPGAPLEGDPSFLSEEELKNVPTAPATLEEALAALEDDQDFLVRGGVFSREVLAQWVDIKMDGEVSASRTRPTPWEFALYFDS